MTYEEKRTEFAKLKPYFWRQLPKKCSNCGESKGLHLHHLYLSQEEEITY
ncbi:formate dehydrogenase maturation protein FdhE [Anoxybacillus rupiensis]|jgi:formate dehydrogenase maturation protein FdhE|nr:formate dehydrogenase maturation protein FdhE [Anoxybacillus rupiensis]